jgi:2'-5' RNA ligase
VSRAGRRPRWPGADLPGRRLFYAVPIPEHAIDRIAALVSDIRAEGVPGGGRDVRWVRLEGLHLTLRFLGPTLDDRIGAASEALRGAMDGRSAFEVSIGGGGTFPEGRRPRALWLDVRDGEEGLVDLAGAIDRELRHAGWVLDPKPFRPHLTLARSDGVPAGAAIGARLIEAADDLDVRFHADRVGLYESVTGDGPARYEPLEVVELA